MAKTFVTSGTGAQQTLSPIQNEKIPVYASVADAEADLSNLSENQIVATKDSGDELAQPVDVIQSGNMHAVTSNAVANSNAMPVDQVALNNLHSVTSNAVARKINTVLGDNTFEINQPALPPANRKRNNIQEQSKEIYSFNLTNEDGDGISIDFNYTSGRIIIHKVINGQGSGAKSVSLS